MIKRIERILIVLALHGKAHETTDISDAVEYLESYHYDVQKLPICRYEIQVKFSNGSSLAGTFVFEDDAIQFLKGLESHLHPIS